jgi:hypothetical protein
MSAALKMLAIVCVMSGGFARAGHQNDQGQNQNDQGQNQNDQGQQGHGYGAPEPVTMIGVALGASAVGLAAWRVRRKRS